MDILPIIGALEAGSVRWNQVVGGMAITLIMAVLSGILVSRASKDDPKRSAYKVILAVSVFGFLFSVFDYLVFEFGIL